MYTDFNLYMKDFIEMSHGYSIYVLTMLKIISLVSAIFVIISKNPIISILYLITLFLSISTYLIIVGMAFIGLSYLLVYVGAVSILFLFILMLINIRISELSTNTTNTIPLVLILTIAFIYPVCDILPLDKTYTLYYIIIIMYSIISIFNNNIKETTNNNIGNLDVNNIYFSNDKNIHYYEYNSFTDGNSWDGNYIDIMDITSIGNLIYTNDALLLTATSIILLLAMVGSIVITLNKVSKNSDDQQ